MNSTEARLADLVGLLRDFEGREYSGPIGRDTLFFADLGFSSIDAVVLGERLAEFYGRPIPFHKFLADASARRAQDIRVGELADFLSQHVAERS
jgi:acyl carrier protein